MRSILLILAVAAILPLPQQAPPATEVYLTALESDGGFQPIQAATWINISNNPGYDNQPSFLPDGSAILFSSNRDGKQMDIYRYDIAQGRVTQVTNTPEGEYSPTVTPDGRTFSAIRTEADGTQRLWRFDLDGSNPRLVLQDVKPVGYHAWVDATHVALFILGSGGGAPATLQLADTAAGTAEVLATGIGRSVLRRPRTDTVSFMTTGESRMIREFDFKTRASKDLIAPIAGSQDAAWSPDGRRLVMANGTTVHHVLFGGTMPAAWAPLGNLASDGADARRPRITNITRMAISPHGRWLAFVAEPAK